MRRFALAGNPISHSLSPNLFKSAYPDKDYTYELLETDSFSQAFKAFIDGYDAINVTAPFKEEAFTYADDADEVTTLLQAANILKKEGRRIKAFNSDYLGVKMILQDRHITGRVLVIGCGGAGRAAALAARDLKLPTSIANRTYRKAVDFCERCVGITPLDIAGIAENISSYDIIIYTLPLKPDYLPDQLFAERTILEANYRNPAFSGPVAKYISGLEWLCCQAIRGFGLMTGSEPDGRLIKVCAEHFIHL